MSLDYINDQISSMGGRFVKPATKGDMLKGEIVAAEERVKTFDGETVRNRKTGEPRKEWVFTLRYIDAKTVSPDYTEKIDGVRASDDQLCIFVANESAQRAIGKASKTSGVKLAVGATLAVAISEDPPSPTSQAEYVAQVEAAPLINITSSDDNPF
jgi:hypothetical protein